VLLIVSMLLADGFYMLKQTWLEAIAADSPVTAVLFDNPMVTALREMGDIEKAVGAGADDFLTKPVNRLELRTRVRSLLRVRHLTSERDRLLAYLQEVEDSSPRPTAPPAE